MNYIGSKRSLLSSIKNILINNNVPVNGIALDLFSGTGAVSKLLKSMGYITYANDWQYYSYITAYAFIGINKVPEFTGLASIAGAKSNSASNSILNYLETLPLKKGLFSNEYGENGSSSRLYFSEENAQKIQAVRDQIDSWKKGNFITAKEEMWLIACLLEAADKIANTSSVYGAYLKKIKSSASCSLKIKALKPVLSSYDSEKHKIFCMDSIELLQKITETVCLTYVDPPYNQRQYSSNYHILETIARWDLDNFEPRGVTGLRNSSDQKSEYCMKLKAENAFEKLVASINSDYILFSYNNEGLLQERKLLKLINKKFEIIKFHKIKYRRFKSDLENENRSFKSNSTNEFLILGKLKFSSSRSRQA
ncbi:MAG: modification methylase [bacterium]|nr:modification methylase [bacterium]